MVGGETRIEGEAEEDDGGRREDEEEGMEPRDQSPASGTTAYGRRGCVLVEGPVSILIAVKGRVDLEVERARASTPLRLGFPPFKDLSHLDKNNT